MSGSDGHTLAVPPVAACVDEPIARRAAILPQARLDGERWLDDGGRCSPEAVAETRALPTPKETP